MQQPPVFALAGRRKPVEDAELHQRFAFLFQIVGRHGGRSGHVEKPFGGFPHARLNQNFDAGAFGDQPVERLLQRFRRFLIEAFEVGLQHGRDQTALQLDRMLQQLGLLRITDLDEPVQDDRNDEEDYRQLKMIRDQWI